jgi:6-phosphogluconolactonase
MKNATFLPDAAGLAAEAAKSFVDAARDAVERRGRFSAALSGGETPRPLYRLLATEPYSRLIDWQKIHVFWSDERCVPPDHPESNYGMARETLLRHVPIPEGNIHRMAGEAEPVEAARLYEEMLHRFFIKESRARFDLTLLGMGSDGHTASLFPGTKVLAEKTRWVAAYYVDNIRAWRITLTAAAINDSRRVIFLVSGKAKAPALRRVLAPGPDEQEEFPAQMIRPADGKLRWLTDEEAASLLPGKPQ